MAEIERRLVAIETRHLVAERPRQGGHRPRAAERLQDEIGGGIVAELHRGCAEIAQAHRAIADMRSGLRRIFQKIRGAIGDIALQRLGPGVDALQHGCGRERLEGRSHRKSLVGAVSEAPTIARVDDRDAEAAAGAPLDLDDARGQIGRTSSASDRNGADSAEAEEKGAATHVIELQWAFALRHWQNHLE
jgi:hypothetical protein